MSLQDKITSAMGVWFDTDRFAETVTYNDADIVAVVGESRQEETDGAIVELVDIEVKLSDVAKPAYRDTVVINSVTWRVKTWIGDGLAWKVTLISDERPVWR